MVDVLHNECCTAQESGELYWKVRVAPCCNEGREWRERSICPEFRLELANSDGSWIAGSPLIGPEAGGCIRVTSTVRGDGGGGGDEGTKEITN